MTALYKRVSTEHGTDVLTTCVNFFDFVHVMDCLLR